MQIGELLEKARAACEPPTWTGLANELDVMPSAVSNWKHKRAFPDEISCDKIAALTGLQLRQVLGIVGEARAISKEAKAVWRKLATAAAVAALCVIPVGAKAIEFNRLAAATSDQCILCNNQDAAQADI